MVEFEFHKAQRYATIVGMKEIVLNFLSILAIVVGLALALEYYFCAFTITGCQAHPITAFIGVPLLAAGLTRFYMRSRFYKKNSN